MTTGIDLVYELTDETLPNVRLRELAMEFSYQFGWRPNDFIETGNDLTTASLVVEHGLDNAAVLSFLPADRRLQDLQFDERRSILGLSYNSLVDWHVWVDRESIEYIYNRTFPSPPSEAHRFDRTDYSALTKDVFDRAVGRAPNPNVPALDGILLDTIANWRRVLRSVLGDVATYTSLSSLFNALIFARAVEDYHAKMPGLIDQPSLREYVEDHNLTVPDAIERSIVDRTGSNVPEALFERSALQPFERLSQGLRAGLVNAFYGHPSVPYAYDFSVMSKHALSKIYERYVTVMNRDEPIQFSMFPSEPEVEWNKRLGGIYTPNYIASFFARYLKSQLSPEAFTNSTILDPACGSGIFLRAVTEQKIQSEGNPTKESAESALGTVFGADIDENAVAASRLSLALLNLASCGELPDEVPIMRSDSLELFHPESSYDTSFDAVMMNPPFVRTELQTESMRQAIVDHVGFAARGKLDQYLAFVVLSIRALKPGGFGFFVIPQPLLTSDNLAKLRNWIRSQAWVRLIADLSAIRVFEANVYIALLIVQRKDESALSEPHLSLISCQRDVGAALEDFLDGRRRETSSYAMFDAPQPSLDRATWTVNAPQETDLLSKLEVMPKLKDYAVVRQGMITGSDEVFVLDKDDVPTGEEALYKPWLPDRMISRFGLPEETGLRVFYPIIDHSPVGDDQIKADFPATWARLKQYEDELSLRASVKRGNQQWWRPDSPRQSREMFLSKIVVPELFLVPRFGLDVNGKWVVSHSPFVCVPPKRADENVLYVLVAILNSSAISWFIDLNARKYRSQYNKLGVALLRRVPIPDLSRISLSTLQQIISLSREVIFGSNNSSLDLSLQLDQLVLQDCYRLSDSEISLVAP